MDVVEKLYIEVSRLTTTFIYQENLLHISNVKEEFQEEIINWNT